MLLCVRLTAKRETQDLKNSSSPICRGEWEYRVFLGWRGNCISRAFLSMSYLVRLQTAELSQYVEHGSFSLITWTKNEKAMMDYTIHLWLHLSWRVLASYTYTESNFCTPNVWGTQNVTFINKNVVIWYFTSSTKMIRLWAMLPMGQPIYKSSSLSGWFKRTAKAFYHEKRQTTQVSSFHLSDRLSQSVPD